MIDVTTDVQDFWSEQISIRVSQPTDLELVRRWLGYADSTNCHDGKRLLLIGDSPKLLRASHFGKLLAIAAGPERFAKIELALPIDGKLLDGKRVAYLVLPRHASLHGSQIARRVRDLIARFEGTLFVAACCPLLPMVPDSMAEAVDGFMTRQDVIPFYDSFFPLVAEQVEAFRRWAHAAAPAPAVVKPDRTKLKIELENPLTSVRQNYDKKLLVSLTPATHNALSAVATYEQKSMAEVVREAIAAHLAAKIQ